MVDNTSQGGLDLIATDELATLNGVAASGEKVQRVKLGYGPDGDLRDVSQNFPLPTLGGVGVPHLLGVNNGNTFQNRVSGTRTAAGVSLGISSSGLFIYITDIFWSNSGATASLLTLVASGSTSGQQDIFMKAGDQGHRPFRQPWKISTVSGIGPIYSISAATTSWFFTVHGFYLAV